MKHTQTEVILDFLLKGGKLTALQALDKFGCFRLASRINDIKNLNRYKIDKETIVTKMGKRVAQYSIQNSQI